jgi:hypothetical protein
VFIIVQNLDNIVVAGIKIALKERGKSNLKGITVDDSVRYFFYDFSFQGELMLLLVSKLSKETPLQYQRRAARLSATLGVHIVFYFEHLDYYEKKRLLEKGVYYVAGKHNAYLPTLLTTHSTKRKTSGHLSACGQYILLSQLQGKAIEGSTISALAEWMPYTYVSIAKGVQNLEDLSLVASKKEPDGTKVIAFSESGRELWEKAKPFMTSPIKKTVFCDMLPSEKFPAAGISALSSFSNLADDDIPTIAVYAGRFKDVDFDGVNVFDGNFKVEIWKYPPIGEDVVDRLSLYLSIEEDQDPRVHKEAQQMLESIWK